MHPFTACPSCKSKQDRLEIYECRPAGGGCGRRFCRQCAGGLTTVRCPACKEPLFTGPVIQIGVIHPGRASGGP